MEFENEVRVALSPGARVVVGSPVLPLVGAVIIGFVLGVAVATRQPDRERGGRPSGRRAQCLGDA